MYYHKESFHGNRSMYKIRDLLRDIKNHPTTLFIGAGATKCNTMSQKHQLPDGTEMKFILLKDRYPNELDEKKLEKQFREEFWKDLKKIKILSSETIPPEFIWEKCFSKYKEDLTWYHRIIEKMFCTGKYIPPSYKFISWLHLDNSNKINHVFTTNFDEKIEDAYKLLQQRGLFSDITVFSATVREDYPKLILPSDETKIIFKLHGTLSKPYTIQSSLTEMSHLSLQKYNALKDIIESSELVIFIGYACNDKDIYNALIKIGNSIPRNKLKKIKFRWVKRSPVDKNSKIYKVLKKFNPESDPSENILHMDGYECISAIFKDNIKTDKIDFSYIKEHTSLSFGRKIGNTGVCVDVDKKEPIKDILHDNISFARNEVSGIFKIINSFDMQRLRDIKQLSFAQYKFPCATHSRFTHSLGVAYLVNRALSENANLKKHAQKIGPEAISNTIYAALIHDVGHGALGHVLDKFYDRRGEAQEHEIYTQEFIKKGLYDLSDVFQGVNLTYDFIKDLIVFKFNGHETSDPKKIFLSWLITDNGLDLDRIDFLLRDKLMTNCDTSATFPVLLNDDPSILREKNRFKTIINNYINRLNVAEKHQIAEPYRSEFPNGSKILYVDDDSRCSTESILSYLLELYTEMYTDVYYHDRIAAAEAMMAKALNIAFDTGDIDRSLLYIFTDSELFSYLEKLEDDLIRELVYSVKMRRLFKPIIEIDLDSLNDSVTACKIEENIGKDLKLGPIDFNSVVIVNLPRKKRVKNLFVKESNGNKIIPYPKLDYFNNKLSTKIKGKIFVNPESDLFKKENRRQEIQEILKKMKIVSSIIPMDIDNIETILDEPTLASFENKDVS
jgi:HD superfamily phosphohydrolase